MEHLAESLWQKVRVVLEALASRLVATDSNLKFGTKRNSDQIHSLSAHLSLYKDRFGEVIDVSVEMRLIDGEMVIGSYIVGQCGNFIADGPSIQMPNNLDDAGVQKETEKWLMKFEEFLEQNFEALTNALSKLK